MREVNAASVMLALRDHRANDLESLCRFLNASPSYGRFQLENVLRELEGAGLIVHAGPPGALSGSFEVAQSWNKIQGTLGISLTKLAEGGSDTMTVRPYFGKPAGAGAPLDVFVLMSFSEELRPIYEDHILSVTKSLNLLAKRADDFFGAHHIMSDVWEAINSARVIIADCTGRNPNVFYEIGVAHTLGRTVILITQNSSDVPFDLQAIRYIQYKYDPRGVKLFEENLARTLKAELETSAVPGAPTP